MPLIVRETPLPLLHCKDHLSHHGWSYRRAAMACGVCVQYLSDVLNGWRISKPLERRILKLGVCPESLRTARATARMDRLVAVPSRMPDLD